MSTKENGGFQNQSVSSDFSRKRKLILACPNCQATEVIEGSQEMLLDYMFFCSKCGIPVDVYESGGDFAWKSYTVRIEDHLKGRRI